MDRFRYIVVRRIVDCEIGAAMLCVGLICSSQRFNVDRLLRTKDNEKYKIPNRDGK
jgi:hypothetical protein